MLHPHHWQPPVALNSPAKMAGNFGCTRLPTELLLPAGDLKSAVVAAHRCSRAQSRRGHAIAHTIVESQLATGEVAGVPATLARLMREEGLDRHDAVHAIGSVLMGLIFNMVTGKTNQGRGHRHLEPFIGDPSRAYGQGPKPSGVS
jgi:hypothetical protein